MHVVGHQHVGMNPTARFVGVFGQPIPIKTVILVGKKAGLTVVAALDQVEWHIRQRDASAAGHRGVPWEILAIVWQ